MCSSRDLVHMVPKWASQSMPTWSGPALSHVEPIWVSPHDRLPKCSGPGALHVFPFDIQTSQPLSTVTHGPTQIGPNEIYSLRDGPAAYNPYAAHTCVLPGICPPQRTLPMSLLADATCISEWKRVTFPYLSIWYSYAYWMIRFKDWRRKYRVKTKLT